MGSLMTRSPRRWLAFAAAVLAETALLLGLVLTFPELLEGVGAWLLWIVVVIVNVLLARALVFDTRP
jgi:hypothetical protein